MKDPLKLIPLTPPASPSVADRPLLIYFPGMDGSGVLLEPQLPSLRSAFEVWGLVIPPHDRRSWAELVEDGAELLYRFRRKTRRPLYLCGESFGGCLALHLVETHPHLCDRLILINCASAFEHQALLRWSVPLVQWFAPSLYTVATQGLLPFLADWERVPSQHRHLLLRAMQAVKPESAAWRLSLLDRPELERTPILQPTLIIAAANDRLLPSVQESQRLAEHCPQSQCIILPESGHTCLLEPDINLMGLLKQANFWPQGKRIPDLTSVEVVLNACH
jgi:pimeloyl-ACP methyl ester carboxylesterase